MNHGLMRKGESEQVLSVFRDQMDANLIYVDATDRFRQGGGIDPFHICGTYIVFHMLCPPC